MKKNGNNGTPPFKDEASSTESAPEKNKDSKGKQEESIEIIEANETEKIPLTSQLGAIAESLESQIITTLMERLSNYRETSKPLNDIEADHLFRLLESLKKIGTELANSNEKFEALETEAALLQFLHEGVIKIQQYITWINSVLLNLTTNGNCHSYLTNKENASDDDIYSPTTSLKKIKYPFFSSKKSNALIRLLSEIYQKITGTLQQLKKDCEQLQTLLPKQTTANQDHSEETVKEALSSDKTNLYDRLGVRRNATQAEIKAAYRKRSLIAHPDKKTGDGEQMKRLTAAYEILSDPEQREIFDAKMKLFDDKKDEEITIKDFLDPDDTPISTYYKKIHTEYTEKYKKEPLKRKNGYSHLKPLDQSEPLYQTKVPCIRQREIERIVQQPREITFLNVISRIFSSLQYLLLLIPSNYLEKTEHFNEESKNTDLFLATLLLVYTICTAVWFVQHPEEIEVTITETEDYETTEEINADNIYSFIQQLEPHSTNEITFIMMLTPNRAVKLLLQFLKGDYYGQALGSLKSYFADHLEQLHKNNPYSPEILLYEGILDIISRKDLDNDEPNKPYLIEQIEKITNYAKKTADALDPAFFTLFKDKYFQALFSQALHAFWRPTNDPFPLNTFDARQEATQKLEELRASDNIDELIMKEVRNTRFTKRFENLLFTQLSANEHDNLREKAFLCLDWIAFFRELSDPAIVINLFFRAGLYFQVAGHVHSSHTQSMADQQLALIMYRQAFEFAWKMNPELALYIGPQILRYMSQFVYDAPELCSFLPACQHRLSLLTELFPFFSSLRSTPNLSKENPPSRQLIQQQLVHLVDTLETVTRTRRKVRIIYQAYEACIKRWYTYGYTETVQEQFRAQLIDLLLKHNLWNYEDVNQNISYPSIMIDRDHEGWLIPSNRLSLPEDPHISLFTSIEGLEINYETGEITFLTKPWLSGDEAHQRHFSSLDLFEILEKKFTYTSFSLDSPNPDLPYHPFNNMRIIPSRLYGTEFLNTMFLCDYLLKFFTVGSQPSSKAPYNNRSIESLIYYLPPHLKQIIMEFNEAPIYT